MSVIIIFLSLLLIIRWRRIGYASRFVVIVIILILSQKVRQEDVGHQRVWFDAPAGFWEASLPLGNGRIGMMPDGGVNEENIVLNDITYWSGWEADYSNPKALEALPEIRRLLQEGRNYEAQNLMYESFTCGNKGSNHGQAANTSYGCYQTLGNLKISYLYDDNAAEPVEYIRSLDINDAVAKTEFRKGDVRYRREYFVSRADDVAIIRFTADKNAKISFTAKLDLNVIEGDENVIKSKTLMRVDNEGGVVSYNDGTVTVRGATRAVLLLSEATNYNNPRYESEVNKMMGNVLGHSYKSLKKAHIKAYRKLYDRVKLELGDTSSDTLTTDVQIKEYQNTKNPYFVSLYFNYGRYLFISSTREDLLPPNLQGLWANTAQTPWNGDYHLNINLQMNHWLANVCNLPELNKPLINLTEGLVASGEKTAKTFYGADGWVAHMMTNPWHFTAPGEHPSWGATNTCGAWLCQHLWKQYLYTQDKEYLREIYPVMRGSARFFHSTMIEEPEYGWLVTAPTSSPENAFYDEEGREVSVCMGSTMDVQIVTELYQNVIAASVILACEDAFIDTLRADMLRFPPMQVSEDGYLQEWLKDYEEVDVHHRHVSHLYGLHPGNLITRSKTPELYEACKVTLERRGDGGTGWSKAWKINFWARLHDGERANDLLTSLISENTYPNLFCAHPPFQIDGNFGGAAGIAEMLIQCHDGEIELLPAIPENWKSGSFKGFCVEGGKVVDCEWKDGEIVYKKVRSR